MRLMQGDIAVYSEGEGKGTTVTVVAPRINQRISSPPKQSEKGSTEGRILENRAAEDAKTKNSVEKVPVDRSATVRQKASS